jgi:Fe2+ or Zn2+ uptake regulation protein
MCGEIRDLDLPALSGMIQQVSQGLDYRGVSHRLDFYGICSRCQAGIS